MGGSQLRVIHLFIYASTPWDLAISEDIFGFHKWREDGTGTLLVETGDVVKHFIMYRIA